jgi:uncharacterized protein
MKTAANAIAMILLAFDCAAGIVTISGNYRIRVESMVDQRFDRIYRQQYDFSCGSATLASLLTYHYNDTVNELTVFRDMYENGDQDKIRQQGFSLLDMKHFLSRRGYQSNGFKISLQQLADAERPGITIINSNGYMHFVIVKAQRNNEVLIGDPAAGLKVIPQHKFEVMWENRIFFLIEDYPELAAYHYEYDKHQEPHARANLGLPIDMQRLDLLTVLPKSNWDF